MPRGTEDLRDDGVDMKKNWIKMWDLFCAIGSVESHRLVCWKDNPGVMTKPWVYLALGMRVPMEIITVLDVESFSFCSGDSWCEHIQNTSMTIYQSIQPRQDRIR